MRMAIDRAGRLVVPKALREQLWLRPGSELEAWVEDGRLVAEPVRQEATLAEENGRLVAVSTDGQAAMTQDDLLTLIDEGRAWPRSR